MRYIFLFIVLADTVEVGGSETMRLARNDYVFVKGSAKPSVMALRLTDKLFSKATLMRSTVHGTIKGLQATGSFNNFCNKE